MKLVLSILIALIDTFLKAQAASHDAGSFAEGTMSKLVKVPNPDDRVEYELWTTPTDVISREFQRQFKVAAVALDKHAYFTPHMYIYNGTKSGCWGLDGSNQCSSLCTNNGRYCAPDPDSGLDRGISGANVVEKASAVTVSGKSTERTMALV